MAKSPSAATWRRVVKQAHAGDPQHLLELLLDPITTDSSGQPIGEFTPLPDDAELRLAIVRALMLGPWNTATTIAELRTRTGWGKGKPTLSAREVEATALLRRIGKKPSDVDSMADALGVEPETLRKRLAKRKKP